MLIHISTAKMEYVTKIDGEEVVNGIPDEIAIDPHKTCEVIRVTQKMKNDQIGQGFILIPMENPRRVDIKTVVYIHMLHISPVAWVQMNESGPLAQDYYRQMGNEIIPASMMPPGNGKKFIHKA